MTTRGRCDVQQETEPNMIEEYLHLTGHIKEVGGFKKNYLQFWTPKRIVGYLLYRYR
jgi:hypothetical protein